MGVSGRAYMHSYTHGGKSSYVYQRVVLCKFAMLVIQVAKSAKSYMFARPGGVRTT